MLLLRNSTKTTRLVLPYEIRVHTAHRDEQIARIVAETFSLSQHSLRIQPLTGGLSNSLFVAYHNQQPVALIRVHPDAPLNTSSSTTGSKSPPPFIDHRTETKLLGWLSQQHLAPKLFGSFQNGRLEEFYPHHQPLSSCRDMIVYAPIIAQRMAQLHALPQEIVTISCFERTRQWLTLAQSLVLQQPDLSDLLQSLQAEWKWTESVLLCAKEASSVSPAQAFLAQRVLTHGDLQSLNVLVHTKDPTDVRIIDYEYASYSPRGFDIANTFCEYCDMNHLRADYEHEYPTTEQQHDFLRSYLTTLGQSSDDVDYLNCLAQQVGRYTVVSHISWAIWSIVQHFQSAQRETFDYLQYARHRLEGHTFSKRRFWSSHGVE